MLHLYMTLLQARWLLDIGTTGFELLTLYWVKWVPTVVDASGSNINGLYRGKGPRNLVAKDVLSKLCHTLALQCIST